MRPLAYTLLAVVGVTAAACTRPAPPAPAARAAPVDAALVASEVLQRLDSAWNAADGARFAAEFSDDADLINIFGAHFSGRTDIAKRMQSIFATIFKGSTHRSRRLEMARYLSPDTILAVSSSEVAVPAGPLAPETRNRQTFILTKNGDTWRIRHWHNTTIRNQPPAPPAGAHAAPPAEEKSVRETVQRFYDTFNSHDWGPVAEFTTEDWTHINPLGGWTRGREAVLKVLKEAHATFLKGVTDTPDEMEVRFATADVGVVTVPSTMKGTFTTPDGKKHENDRNIRTFVVVRRGGKWLIMQDQNTIRGG